MGKILVFLPNAQLDEAACHSVQVAAALCQCLKAQTGENSELVIAHCGCDTDAFGIALAADVETTVYMQQVSLENGQAAVDPNSLALLLEAALGVQTDASAGIDENSAYLGENAAQIVLLPVGAFSTDIASLLAAKLGSGAITDAKDLKIGGGQLLVTKDVLSGSWSTSTTLRCSCPFVTVRPDCTVDGQEVGGDAAGSSTGSQVSGVPTASATADSGLDATQLPALSVPLLGPATRLTVVATEQLETSGPSLTAAKIVVCGGRGIDGDFTLVNDLAGKLGGAVGATRVAADEGWVSRQAQIGQTGATISPDLYIGLGVSGQIHHTSGMQSAKKIVAVVDDPDAPIVEMADLTIIGDVHEVIPQALENLE